MSLFISSLNTGSNGNCFYVGNGSEAILVDAGISCREIEKRMKRLDLSMQKVKAVFISHEHSDHIRGLHSLVKKFHLPVYITSATARSARLFIDNGYIRNFTAHNPVQIGDLSITAFPKFHDASDPYSFTITGGKIKVGVFTDIGKPCEHLISQFSQCHAAFLEANYDEELLEKGSYPFHLKRRIRSGHGHLSNLQALDLFRNHRPPFMSHLILSHLSQNNNCPRLVKNLFDRHASGVEMIVASRHEESPLFCISNNNQVTPPAQQTAHQQLELQF